MSGLNVQYPFGVEQGHVDRLRQAVIDTAAYFDIDQYNAMLIGGSGLVMHGLFTAVPMYRQQRATTPQNVDVDVIAVPGSNKQRLSEPVLGGYFTRGIKQYSDSHAPLDLTIIRGWKSRQYAYKYDYPNLDAMLEDSQVIDGLSVFSMEGILKAKLEMNRPKDVAGIIGGQMIAHALSLEAAEDDAWQAAVSTLIVKLNPSNGPNPMLGHDQTRPDWLNELVAGGFNHPAFDGLH